MELLKTDIQNENKQNNDELLNLFVTKFEKYKSELEKAVSQRGDKQDVVVEELKVKVDELIKEFTNLKITWQNNYTELSEKVDTLNDKIIKNNNTQNNKNIIFEKQLTDIGNIILELLEDKKKLERKLSKLDKKIYEIPLFELYNNRIQKVQIMSISLGIPTNYKIITEELQDGIQTADFFALFGLKSSPVTEYLNYIEPNHIFEFRNRMFTKGFQVLKQGKYIFEINLIAKGDIKGFNLYWTSDKGDRDTRSEFIEKDVKKEITIELNPTHFMFIYPDTSSDFTIESGSYVKVTYSWKGII